MIDKIKKIAYSFGAVATALSYQSFSTYIIFFYVDINKLATGLAATAMLIYGIWNAVNDPIAGFISDRTRTGMGRRIPYVLFFSVPFGLVYYFIWAVPSGLTQSALFTYFLVFICLFDMLYSIVVLNWASLFPEMFQKMTERTEVNSYRQAFGMIGLMIGIALPPLIFSNYGWKIMGIMFGSLITAAYLVTLLGSREKREFMKDRQPGFKDALISTVMNKPFLAFVISNLFIQYAFTMVLAMIPFYAKYVLRIEPLKISMLLFSAFLAAFFMMFAWRMAANRFGPRTSYMASIIFFMLSLLPFIIINDYAMNIFMCCMLGTGLAGIILISDVLISDVIDADEVKTNSRREGMYFGVNAFITRFAIALEAISISSIFNLTGYDPRLSVQPEGFLTGIKTLLAVLPASALAISFAVMLFYPLHGKKLDALTVMISKLHKSKSGKSA